MAETAYAQSWSAEAHLGVAKIQIRSAADVEARLKIALKLAPPTEPNRETRRDGLACATIAPGEWLLTGHRAEIAAAIEQVGMFFADDLYLATDLSAGRFASRFTGAAAAALLANYTPLNLAAAHYPVGAATRAMFGDIGMFISRLDDAPTFRVIIDQSMTPYFLHLLRRLGVQT